MASQTEQRQHQPTTDQVDQSNADSAATGAVGSGHLDSTLALEPFNFDSTTSEPFNLDLTLSSGPPKVESTLSSGPPKVELTLSSGPSEVEWTSDEPTKEGPGEGAKYGPEVVAVDTCAEGVANDVSGLNGESTLEEQPERDSTANPMESESSSPDEAAVLEPTPDQQTNPESAPVPHPHADTTPAQPGPDPQPERASPSPGAPSKPYVRVAEPEDFEQIVEVAHNAFVHDPVELYFGNVKEITADGLLPHDSTNLRVWVSYLYKLCMAIGGRVTVVVDPSLPKVPGPKGEGEREKVCAAAYWLPPKKRISVFDVRLLVKCGLMETWKGWGLSGVYRAGFEYLSKSEKVMKKVYRAKGVKKSVEDSWYLLHMMTDPVFQGKGYMSMIIREALEHAPDAIFAHEATTAKSRDQYVHLGYELVGSFKIGKGKVGPDGLPAKGKGKEEASGVEAYAMLKLPPSKEA
ncbi:hypothetical protein CC2G_001960 [Coprinopsis cinerea AmutBmut pab1-1]|nr:hypothetical protein CC2G_001960 [Coprinopsis cinerea AmutBmut pab1-1]